MIRNTNEPGGINLALIKALTYLMFMMFALTTDSVGIIIPEIIKTFGLSMTASKYVAENRDTDPRRAGTLIGFSWVTSLVVGAATEVIAGDISAWLTSAQLPPHAYAVIVTRGHTNDLEALRALAPRDLRYLGLIGSRAKVARIYDQLVTDHMAPDVLK